MRPTVRKWCGYLPTGVRYRTKDRVEIDAVLEPRQQTLPFGDGLRALPLDVLRTAAP